MRSQLGRNREYKDFPSKMPHGRKVWNTHTDNSSGTHLGKGASAVTGAGFNGNQVPQGPGYASL